MNNHIKPIDIDMFVGLVSAHGNYGYFTPRPLKMQRRCAWLYEAVVRLPVPRGRDCGLEEDFDFGESLGLPSGKHTKNY